MFRCVYCLWREGFLSDASSYHADHYLPQVRFPGKKVDYGNLVYSCARCNLSKGEALLPDPEDCMIAGKIEVLDTGEIRPLDDDARRIVRILALDSDDWNERRSLMIDILALVTERNIPRRLLGFPKQLPNLRRLKVPLNDRPEGVSECFHERRKKGDLPEVY
ncbi:HNH endonuclease [Luteolibacter sp. Populi]|uniref:HNH endonuclease n=1 Tax=Luteolibacter sp. Populi TaxID=3230487 RepID=UPI003464F942